MKRVDIVTRRATVADAALLADLGARTFLDTYADTNAPENLAGYVAESFAPDVQAAELADGNNTFLIAEIDSKPAGYAHLRRAATPPSIVGSRPVEIVRLYAEKSWIGRGVGAALMSACLEHARAHHHDTIWLGVWERNPRAVAFYRKWGFNSVGTQTFRVGGDVQTDRLMSRPAAAG